MYILFPHLNKHLYTLSTFQLLQAAVALLPKASLALGVLLLVLVLPLGLDLVLVQQGGCRIYRTAPGAFLGICKERQGRVSNQDGLVICLVSQDVDGWHDRLSAAGIAIETPPTYSEVFGVYHIFLRDPDGHLVEIQRFDDADWHEPLDGGA